MVQSRSWGVTFVSTALTLSSPCLLQNRWDPLNHCHILQVFEGNGWAVKQVQSVRYGRLYIQGAWDH